MKKIDDGIECSIDEAIEFIRTDSGTRCILKRKFNMLDPLQTIFILESNKYETI